jgi:hypothetical protein
MNEANRLENAWACLKRDQVSCGGAFLSYALWRCTDASEGYRLAITYGNEQETYPLGEDLFFAVTCYRTLLLGRVTPVCAGEVLEDLQYLEKSGAKL